MKKLPLSLFGDLSNNHLIDEGCDDNAGELSSIGLVRDEKPTQLLYYTKTASGEIRPNDKDGLKSLSISIGKRNEPKSTKSSKLIGADLTTGYESFKKSSNSEVYQLDALFTILKYYLENTEDKHSPFSRIRCTILSLRRNLLMLMLIPLNHWKEYKFNVVYWKGIIILNFDWEYFEDDVSVSMSKLSLGRRNNTDLLQYTGFKFENLITLCSDKANDFYSLVAQEFGTFNTILTAEVDAGIDQDATLSSYVELKTHSQTKSQIDFKLASKLMSSWCQTKLVDGKHVVIGFRSKGYNLASIRKYESNEIVNLLNSHPLKLPDNTNITCKKLFKWYKRTLKWIVDLVSNETGDKDRQVFKILYSPKSVPDESCLSIENVDSVTSRTIFNETVPQWFEEYMNKDTASDFTSKSSKSK